MKKLINGILLLDKALNISSNTALQQVKRLFQARKAGHTGSLDPLATGMLPICFGEATKFSQFLLHADKTYRVKACLGTQTSTGDSEGEIVQVRPIPTFTDTEFDKILKSFCGAISQIPPMFSALKLNGQPLYKLARQGISVERKSRQITIHSIKRCDLSLTHFELELHCSSGTYVRTLVEDIGEVLGCGAHVIALRRLQVDPYQYEQMQSLESLIKQSESAADSVAALVNTLLPIDSVLQHYPTLFLEEYAALYLRQGKQVAVPHHYIPQTMIRLYDHNQKFIGIGEIQNDDKVASKRLISELADGP